MRTAWAGIVLLTSLAASAADFEIVALADHLDFATIYDIETKTGIVQCLEHILKVHATDVWWRDKSGGKMRYPGGVESWPLSETPFERLRLPCEDVWGHLRLEAPQNDSLPLVREECRKRGVRFGIHTTTEENHWCSQLAASWTLAHPQYWSCTRGGIPWMGACSIGEPDVRAHKLAMVDERLSFKPEAILLDTWRHGDWSAAREYTPRMCAEWRARFGSEPPPATDPRWTAFVAEKVLAYYRAFSAKCRAAGVRFVVGVSGVDGKTDAEAFHRAGVDWKQLTSEGLVDAVWVTVTDPAGKDPEAELRRVYAYAMAHRGRADIYFSLTAYPFREACIPRLAERLKISPAAAATRLLRLAREAGGRGVVLECVDYGNYTSALCAAIADELNRKEN